MAPKKSKGGAGGKKKTPTKGKKGANKPQPQTDIDSKLVQQSQLNPQERVAFVRPLWESLTDAERVELLTVRVDDVVSRLKQQTRREGREAVSDLEKIYDRGLERLNKQETWKVWQWIADRPSYTCAETFKKEELEQRLPEALRALLPREEGKPTEKPAEAALRERMTALINNIHNQLQSAQDAWRRGQRAVTEAGEQTRDANIDLVISILDTLQHEHHCLYHTILTPVAEFICALLPAKIRKSTKTELFFEDFEKITPEDVAKLYEWLTEKVDALCSKLKPDPKDEDIDEDEEAVGDIDLFSLTDDKTAFTVNVKWMEHLQERKLSEEGQPRKVKKGEDIHRVGLVLEWVYGSIVSTAEKARDGAKRPLGDWTPSVDQAYQNLLEILKDQSEWDTRCKSAKAILKDLLSIRKRMTAMAKQHGIHIPGTAAAREANAACDDIPDRVIEGILCRESLLTQAKLHILKYEHLIASNQLKTLRTELMQGEPELERLKRELESAKHLVRGDKDRQRSKVNEALLEDQLEVQSAFREQGVRLQGMYDKRQRTEMEMARREQEIRQLENWHKNVTALLTRLRNGLNETSPDEAALMKARATFHKDFKKQLYSDLDDQSFFNRIKSELKTVETHLEDGAVVLQHLEMFLINVACDDPGAVVGTSVILPLLQERLDKKAMEYGMQRATEAMDDLLKMEEEVKAKQELKRRHSKAPTVEDTAEELTEETEESMSGEAVVELTPSETTEVKEVEVEVVPEPVPVEMPILGSRSVEDPVLVQQSMMYEREVLADAEEFQSVSNRRRGDRKRQQAKHPHGSNQRRHPSNRDASDSSFQRSHSSPSQTTNNKSSGAKVFRTRSAKPQPSIKPSPKPEETKPNRIGAAWVKGTIPTSVISGPPLSKRSTSESSVNSPPTPEASDPDHLATVDSDPSPQMDCPITTADVQETPMDDKGDSFEGDGAQFYQMVQAMSDRRYDDAEDEKSVCGRSDRSSDATTPEPEHLMMGPPLLPPPLGLTPLGALPFPPFYPVQSMPGQFPDSEPDSPSASATHYPYFPPMMGHHMPMPPYLPVMPYGQWFPPCMPPANYETQVMKFPLSASAEEFFPPSMQPTEGISVIDEEESVEDIADTHMDVDDDNNDYNVESAVALAQTIEQPCC